MYLLHYNFHSWLGSRLCHSGGSGGDVVEAMWISVFHDDPYLCFSEVKFSSIWLICVTFFQNFVIILTISLLDRNSSCLAKKDTQDPSLLPTRQGHYKTSFGPDAADRKGHIPSGLDIYILLLDMSKAFDTVNRKILQSDLATIHNIKTPLKYASFL